MHYTYKNSPLVCSSQIDIDIDNGVITNVAFTGGCPGNLTAIGILVKGKKPQEVIDSIMANVRHGITKINARGAYKGDDEVLLYTVVNAFQTSEVVKYALQGDPAAFIETRNTLNVYGNYYQKPLD